MGVGPRPSLMCLNSKDVAKSSGSLSSRAPLAVRAGGHSAAGHSSVAQGVVVDLRAINHVRVDPDRRVAAIGGGALAGQVDRATHAARLATTTATVSTVGMGGFALAEDQLPHPQRGLAVDNMVGADVVLADGTRYAPIRRRRGPALGADRRRREPRRGHRTADAAAPGLGRDRRADGLPPGAANRLVRLYRDWMPTQADDIYAFLDLLTAPPSEHFPPNSGFARPALWCGATPHGRTGSKRQPGRRSVPSGRWSTASDNCPPRRCSRRSTPARSAGKYAHLTGLLFEDLPELRRRADPQRVGGTQPTPLCQTHLYPLDGAAARADRGDTAWPWSEAAFAQMVAAVGTDHRLPGGSAGFMQTRFRDVLRPYAMPGCYANFQIDEGPNAARACYGRNADRLATLKGRYDPTNLFPAQPEHTHQRHCHRPDDQAGWSEGALRTACRRLTDLVNRSLREAAAPP